MHISQDSDLLGLGEQAPTPNSSKQHSIMLCKSIFPYDEEVTEATLPTLIERIPQYASQYFLDESKWGNMQQALLQITNSQEVQGTIDMINTHIEELRKQLISSFQNMHPMSINTYVALKQMYGEQVADIDYTIGKGGYSRESFLRESINGESRSYADLEQDIYQLSDALSADISRGNISDDIRNEVVSMADELNTRTNDTHRPLPSHFTSVKERIFSLVHDILHNSCTQ